MVNIFITRQSRYQVDIKDLKKKVKDTLLANGVTQAEVSVAIVGGRKMRELGQKFLGEDKNEVHEVLSFPSHSLGTSQQNVVFPDAFQMSHLGDIVICYPEVVQIAIAKNRMVDEVLGELVEHGTLHLLGIHHE